MTARGPDPAARREARLLARAETLARIEGCSLKHAARVLRDDRVKVALAASGDITPAAMFKGIRAGLPPEVRKAAHDSRAVRS